MSNKTKIKSLFDLEDEYEYKEQEIYEEEPVHESKKTRSSIHQAQPSKNSQNVVSLQSVQKSAKLILMEPRSYSEAQEVADHLKSRRAVIVNLHRIHQSEARKIVDYLGGTVYAIDGRLEPIGKDIILCTPDNVDIAGSISEFMQQEEDYTSSKRW